MPFMQIVSVAGWGRTVRTHNRDATLQNVALRFRFHGAAAAGARLMPAAGLRAVPQPHARRRKRTGRTRTGTPAGGLRSPGSPELSRVGQEDIMDHSQHTRLQAEELNQHNLEGATIYGPDDAEVGTVSHLHGSGPAAMVIVDVGGFLGIGAKPVALSLSRLDFMRDEDGSVHAMTTLTKDEAKALPEHQH